MTVHFFVLKKEVYCYFALRHCRYKGNNTQILKPCIFCSQLLQLIKYMLLLNIDLDWACLMIQVLDFFISSLRRWGGPMKLIYLGFIWGGPLTWEKGIFYMLCTIFWQRDHCIPPKPFFFKVSSIVYIHVKAYQSKEIFQLIFVSVLQPSSDISIYKMSHLFCWNDYVFGDYL